MKSMVEFIKKDHHITYGTFDVEATTPNDYPEALRGHVGSSYGGECNFYLLTTIMLLVINSLRIEQNNYLSNNDTFRRYFKTNI